MSNYTPTYFQSYSPRVRVLLKDIETAELLYDLSDDLISLSTNKAYGRCSGTWQLMLSWNASKTSKRWDQVINARRLDPTTDVMVTIEMDAGNGAGYFPVMCGLIDRVSTVRQGGAIPQRAIKISGRDMGKLLETHDVAYDIVKYNMALATLSTQDSKEIIPQNLMRQWDPGISMGSPGYLIQRAFETVFPDMTVLQRIRFTDFSNDIWKQSQTSFMTTQGTTFWQFIKRMEHYPYSILTTDTNRTNPDWFHVTLERFPYNVSTGKIDRSQGTSAYTYWHTISNTEIIAEDLGVGDQERINLLSYQSTFYLQNKVMTYDVMMVHPDLTKYDTTDMQIHGLCPKVFNDNYLPPDLKDVNDKTSVNYNNALKDSAAMKDTLWAWYSQNHTYASGTMSVHLRPDIRVGNGLLVAQDDGTYFEYFIEQISHQCTFNPQPQFVTTLQLTRGQQTTPNNQQNVAAPQPVTKDIPSKQ